MAETSPAVPNRLEALVCIASKGIRFSMCQWAAALAVLLSPAISQGCDSRVPSLLAGLPPTTDDRFPGKALYWEKEAQSGDLQVVQTYLLARAGCETEARSVGGDLPQLDALLTAARMRRIGVVDGPGYALLELHRLERLILPLLDKPETDALLLRYARHPDDRKGARPPLDEAYQLLHEGGQFARAAELMDRAGPLRSDDLFIRLQLSWAHRRLGRADEATRELKPLLNHADLRSVHIATLGIRGEWDEALVLVDEEPVATRWDALRPYTERTGDFEGARQRVQALGHCARAWFAALQRRYLEAIELADTGKCEGLYSYVPPQRSHRLTQRYSAAGLYAVAAKRGDGLLFRHFARRAGAREGYSYIPTTPVIEALVAAGRDAVAMQVLLEDGSPKSFHAFTWSNLAQLATDEFDFESWMDLALVGRDAPYASTEPLVDLAQSFAARQPERALAWMRGKGASLTGWHRRVIILGLARGLAVGTLPRCGTEFRPVAVAYRTDPEGPRVKPENRRAASKIEACN